MCYESNFRKKFSKRIKAVRIKLGIPSTLHDIIKYAHLDKKAYRNALVQYITTDSRECEAGDLFIALRGENSDGNYYAEDARRRGAFVISERQISQDIYSSDTRLTFLNIAMGYKRAHKGVKKSVAVTGSVGKSTTKEFIKNLLSEKYKVHATHENYNNEIGVPITVLTMTQEKEILVAEMGMNHSTEISRLSKCVEPDIALINNIGTAHIGNLGSRMNIAKAKLEICDGMKEDGTLFIPSDEPLLKGRGIGVSCKDKTAVAFLDTSKATDEGIIADFHYRDRTVCGLQIKALGEHLISNLAFALAVSINLGLSDSEIISGIRNISKMYGTGKFVRLGEYIIYDDSYNASYESVLADMKLLSHRTHAPKALLLTDILELGEYSAEIHERIGHDACDYGFDRLYAFGKYAEFTALGATCAGMDKASVFTASSDTDIEYCANIIDKSARCGEVILAKGSHRTGLTKILDFLEKRYRKNNA